MKRCRSDLPLLLNRRVVTKAMASPHTMLKGPHTTLLRLIQTPTVRRQNMVSTISPKKAPNMNSQINSENGSLVADVEMTLSVAVAG